MRAKIFSFVILTFTFSASAEDNWQFVLEPYLSFSNISGDAKIGRTQSTELDLDFSTILDNLEMGAMLRGEVLHSSGWGVALDYGFMDLGQKKSSQQDGYLDVSLRQGIFEALGYYRFQLKHGYLDYMAGVRWWDNDISLALNPAIIPGSVNGDIKEDWIDMIGAIRWSQRIAEKFDFIGRIDVGGFGYEADFTAGLSLGFNYQFSESIGFIAKYRGIWVDYTNDEPTSNPAHFNYDTVTHGPILAVAFEF